MLKEQVEQLNDEQLMELLEIVSNEIKRRNQILATMTSSPEEAAKEILNSLFPKEV